MRKIEETTQGRVAGAKTDSTGITDIGVATLDREGLVIFSNETFRRWLGSITLQTGSPLLQAGLGLLVSKERLVDLFATGQPADWRVTVGGLDLQISAYPILNGLNEQQVLLTVYNSVPLRMMQERLSELQAAADELDATFQNSYDAIYIVDQNGITIKTNDAIERLTGIPKEYYIGKDLRYLEKRGIVQKSVSFEVMKEKKPVSVIQENALGKLILITGSPVFNEQGDVIRVVTNLRDISELNRLREELSQLRKFHAGEEPMIVVSQAMQRVVELALRVANTDTTVLLLGESGVGKDVIARMIHRNSGRYEKGSFIKVNCGAIPQELLESELFGYESGAFTGAKKDGKHQTNKTFAEETLRILQRYEWPGNIRELANLIERLSVITPSQRIEPEHLPYLAGVSFPVTEGAAGGTDPFFEMKEDVGLQSAMEQFERKLVEAAYEKHGSSYGVARALKISQSTAIRKAYKYGIRIKQEE